MFRTRRITRVHLKNRGQEVDDELMLNVLRCQLTYWGQVVTNAEARFNNSLRPRKPEGSLGRTAQDCHLDSHTAPDLWARSVPELYFILWQTSCSQFLR